MTKFKMFKVYQLIKTNTEESSLAFDGFIFITF